MEQDNSAEPAVSHAVCSKLRNQLPATHVLLMDDDAIVEPESILRAAAFLSLARGDVAIGGHMLDPLAAA